jgi:hypothetical protein
MFKNFIKNAYTTLSQSVKFQFNGLKDLKIRNSGLIH